MRVVTVQFNPEYGKKKINLAMLDQIFHDVSVRISNIDIVAIPKWFSTGFLNDKDEVAKWAEPIPGPTTIALGNISRKNKVNIVGGTIVERDGRSLFDTCPLFDRDGKLIGKYRRMHIGGHHSKLGMINGINPDNYPVFEMEGEKIGVFVAYDAMFPEVPRILALKGAKLLFWVAATDYKRMNMYGKLLDSHAFANQVYVVASNQAGSDNIGRFFFFGNSRIINPMGETVSSAGTFFTQEYQNRVAYADVNLNMVPDVGGKSSDYRVLKGGQLAPRLLDWRRPDTYGKICS